MAVFPDDVSRLSSISYRNLLIQERELLNFVHLNGLMVGVFMMEGAIEVSGLCQFCQVFILVRCHLILDLARFFKFALTQRFSSFG